jgi:hypothetical protein
MIGGRDVLRRLSRDWRADVPWFALVDPNTGEVVATSVDADGTGWSMLAAPEDLVRFRDMLRLAGSPLTDAQFDVLLLPLHPAKPADGSVQVAQP